MPFCAFLQNTVIAHLCCFYHKAWVLPRKELNCYHKSYSDTSTCLWAFVLHSNGQSLWNTMKTGELFLQNPLALMSNVLSNLMFKTTHKVYLYIILVSLDFPLYINSCWRNCFYQIFISAWQIHPSLLMKHVTCCWCLLEEKEILYSLFLVVVNWNQWD